MKFRILLFFILVFFLGAFSAKAKDLVYNGKVEIEINISKIQAYLVKENKSGDPDNKLSFYKKNKNTQKYNDYSSEFTGTCPQKIESWKDWTEVNKDLPYYFYIKSYSVSNMNLRDFFGKKENTINFKYFAREHDGSSSGDRYKEDCFFTLLDIFKDDLSPGWHTSKKFISDGDKHWAVEFEYSITPPSIAITSPSRDSTSFEEGSIVPLKVDNFKDAKVEYEWMVQIDGASTLEKTKRKILGQGFFFGYESIESLPWIRLIGREPEDRYNRHFYANMSSEEIWRVTQYISCILEIDLYNIELKVLYEQNLMYETIKIPYFQPAVDSKTKSNITKDGTCDYILPESDQFYHNYKFRVQPIVRSDKDDLKCIEEDKIIIIDVFPHFPVVENVETTLVTCNGENTNGFIGLQTNQSDGTISFTVKGDVGNGVEKYRAQLRKKNAEPKETEPKETESEKTDITKWPNYGKSKEFKYGIITFDKLVAGEYVVVVSNVYSKTNTDGYEENAKYKEFFLLGHQIVNFTITENPRLALTSFTFESTGNCDEYKIINPISVGGTGEFKYSLSEVGTYGEIESLAPAIQFSGEETEKSVNLYIMDKAGCVGQGTSVLTRDAIFEFIVPLQKKLPTISCFGETTSCQVSAQGGSGTYQFEMDKPIDDSSKSSNDSFNFDMNAGTHVFYAKEGHGCTLSESRIFSQKDLVEIYDFKRTKKISGKEIHISCNGAEDGEVKFMIKGGTPPYSYTLEGPTPKSGTEISNNTEVVIQGLLAGSYVLTISDINNCGLSLDKGFDLIESTKVVVNPEYPDYSGYNYKCFGDIEIIKLKVSGGISPYVLSYGSEVKNISNSGDSVEFDVQGTNPDIIINDTLGCHSDFNDTLIEPELLTVKFECSTYKLGPEGGMGEEYQIRKYGGTDTLNVKVRGGITPYSLKLFKDEILVDINDIGGVQDSLDASKGNYIYTGLKTGNYIVEVFGAFGECSVTDSIDLLEPDKLEVDTILSAHNGYNIKCHNETGWLKAKPIGGIAPYTLSLSRSGQDFIFEDLLSQDKLFDNLVAGVYKLTATDKYGIQIEKTDIEIKQPEKLELTLTKTSTYVGGYQIRCSNLTDSVSLTPKYGIIPTADNGFVYTIMRIDKNGNNELLENVTGTEVISDMGAGDYTYVLADENMCYDTLEISLTKPEELVFTSVLHKIPSCHEMDKVGLKNDGEIKVKAKGGNFRANEFKVYNFLLAKQADDFSFTPIDTLRGEDVNFELLKTGNYQVTVVDSNTCITTTRVSVGQPPLLYLDYFQSYKPKCYNSFDGFWKSKIIGGTPRVDGYDFSILKDTETFIASNSSIDSINTIGLEKGTYQIQIHDSLQCYFEQEIILPNPDPLEIHFKVLGTSAFGALDGEVKAMITGGTATDYKYKWYHKGLELNGENGTEIKMKPAGDYTVEVWDANNCPYGDSSFGRLNGLKKTVSVKGPGEPLSLSVLRTEPASYVGEPNASVDLTAIGGWPGYQYSIGKRNWQIKSVFENLLAGSYYARVRDTKGIMDSIMVTLNELPQIIADLNVTNVNCKGEYSGQLDFKVKGGSSPYQYSLNKGQFHQTESIFTRLKANTYTLWVEDKRGNTEQFVFEISEPEKLEIIVLEQNSSLCSESNGSAKLSINGGIRPYQLNWDHTELGNSLNPKNLTSGSYRITAIDSNGCFDEKIINIADKNGPELFLKDLVPVSCHDKKDGSVGVDIKGGKEPYVISWNNDPEKNNSYVEGLGMGIYNVTVRDANNCFGSAKYEIEGPPDLQFYVSSLQPPNCVGIDDGNIQFMAEGGTPEYIYRLNNNSNTTGWFPNLGVGNLQLEVTDSHGCKKALEAELSAPVPLTIDLPNEYILCRNQTETVNSGVDGASNKWFFGDNQFSTNNEVELTEEGDYRLVVTTEKGCEAEHKFTIAFLDYEVVADFIIPVEAIVGDTIVAVDISWELPDSVQWHFPDQLEVVKREEASIWLRVLEAGNHTIGMSIFKNQCSDYMEKQVRVESSSTKRKAGFIQPKQVYITEAKLYPNPNKGNFHLKILLSKITDVKLEIYDVERAIIIDTQEGHNNAAYQFDFNNKSIFRPNNVYAVVIIAGNEKRVLRFLVY